MLTYEISKNVIRAHGGRLGVVLAKGIYNVWDDERVKNAFNNGHGTAGDFERYKRDNRQYCVFVNVGTVRK